jgi:chorismate dehydratase
MIVAAVVHTIAAMSFRVASVSFVNARPLIAGLERESEVKLELAVPSALLGLLESGRADVGLLPTIDYQRMSDLVVMPAGGIASDGPTLTVRIFSRVPVQGIESLACDTDSHTSVALARIILARRYDLRPELIELTRASDAKTQARLLIGDKVVCDEPRGFEHQLDLGQEWKAMTGLPFVFAVWCAKPAAAVERVNELLLAAKERGKGSVEEIVEKYAVPRGWPAGMARQYLTRNLQFDIGAREIEAMRVFHRLALEEGIIPSKRELNVFAL